MEKYVIFMDVSGDLDPAYAAEKGLCFVPMQYSLGKEMRVCSGIESEEVLKKFYDGQRNGDLTQTSQITPYMYEEYFDSYMKDGYSILYIALSSGLSSTYSAACVAKETLKEKYPDVDLYPVDSKGATGGMGVLVERAFSNKEKGMTAKENYEDIVSVVPHLHHWLMVQDLFYLKRGGRVSATTAVLGTVLGIKPILMINKEGKLDTIAKKRGNKNAALHLVQLFKESYDETIEGVIYVSDGDAKELGDFTADEVKKLYPNAVVKRASLSPIIGAHTGPGMVIICHLGK